ncbi:hypothetical protein QLX41_gp082 [Listeria phage LMTA-94]|uniref:Uncharacterized protein n=8 Tax=Pecentumvirus TaxID=1857844 RepID=S4U854_9CAUD|nr:hypothetical protein QLX35_gp145 [Listeria phage LP-125]YP_009043113.1 virion structural protein [Listeria phage LMSP-25]YP_009592652.1 virion structural protein [Listeria phage LP-064]YP_009616231.1 virion structural protein [Listeria phage LMTA-34]YP_009793414.1 hypothetical protein QLX42_gp111 [Listeria phage LMTA-57]YP_009793581.1 hypothetical protein QLX41_gp082 [Listeria phage LMTA-94]QNL31869.1 hypothetical protein HUK29_0102 [Listeria phage LP-Mix_6.1]QNL32067.1 hypothetical prote
MAIATYNAHVYAALNLKSKIDTTFMAIGKTTAWTDETNPPEPDPNATGLTEVIGYKKLKTMSLCRPQRTGETPTLPTVSYGNKTWVLVPDAQAYTEGAKWLYCEAEFVGDELPVGTYRQVGVFTDLAPKSGVTKPNLLPSEVANVGVLQFFENKQFQNRTPQVTARERFVAEL